MKKIIPLLLCLFIMLLLYLQNLGTPKSLTISFAGDIMLSRGVQVHLDSHGYDYPYTEVREIFLNDDWTVGNLECPISENKNAAAKAKRFIFRADIANAGALKRAGFDCLSLANNHSMDYQSKGLSDTMHFLSENGLSYVGAAENAFGNFSRIFEKNGIRIGLLAYSTFPPEGFFYDEDRATIKYISPADMDKLREDLQALDCDFKIVYFHWGREFVPYPIETQQILAKKAIDDGADFVLGTHPHVLQPSESYKGKYIYYSIGNFIFDTQIPPNTDKGMILQLTINKQGLVEIREIPVKIEQAKARIAD